VRVSCPSLPADNAKTIDFDKRTVYLPKDSIRGETMDDAAIAVNTGRWTLRR
jgi:hypothetical protein